MRRIVSLTFATALLLAGCNTSGQGVPSWQQAQRAIEWHYENNAWERGASCIPPRMIGITATRVVEETPERLVLDVRYMWDVEGQRQEPGFVGVPCWGSGERTFVLSKTTGGAGYSVASMSGSGRS